jgi:hypothetical protein
MRKIERFDLIDRIGRELQSRMTSDDIDVYLSGFGVDTAPKDRSYNSKWVYTKDLLAAAPEETVIRIADELDLDHPYVLAYQDVTESRFWEPGHLRVFLSHLSSFRMTAGALQRALRSYGISAFVAHVDIEPTKEWQMEIEAALFSMDALVAITMTGFKESNWTDQEVGVAIGRGVLVIPVIKDLDPYGFIGKYQGFNARGKRVSEVARSIFDILVRSPKTRSKMLSALVDTAASAGSADEALKKLHILGSIREVPTAFLQRFRDGASGNAVYALGSELRGAANEFLTDRGQGELSTPAASYDAFELPEDDGLPF